MQAESHLGMVLWNVVQDLPTGLQSLGQVRKQSGTFIPVTQALWGIIDILVRNLDALLKVVQVSELQEPFVQMYPGQQQMRYR